MRIDIRLVHILIRLLNEYLYQYNKRKEKLKNVKWNKLFTKDTKIVSKLADSLIIYHFQDSILSKLIYEGFEESEIIFLRMYLAENDVFVDVGANIGLFSLHAAQIVGPKGKVYSFEPAPVTFSRLILNVELNKFQEIISCKNIGLSENPGVLKMNTSSNGYDAWNTFASPVFDYFDKQIDVPVDTLDNFLLNNNIDIKNVSLIKVDVEGWEVFVFKGAANSLKNKDAPPLLVEFTESYSFAAGTNCYELYDLIQSYGYSWYAFDKISNQLIPEPKRLHYPYNNLIAVKDIETAQKHLWKIV